VDAAGAITAAVGFTVLIGALLRGLRFLVHLERLFGDDEDGQSIRDRVRSSERNQADMMGEITEVKKALNNGLRSAVARIESRVEVNAEEAAEARALAAEAARLAGRAAAEAATAAQLQAEERARAAERHAQNAERLNRLEAERRAGWLREQTYLASLRELGLDIEPAPPRSMPRGIEDDLP